jgi:dienelactone hydrolase
MHVLAMIVTSSAVALCCLGATVQEQVRALRPSDTAASENAVLDDLQHRAQDALARIRHSRTPAEVDAARAELRRKLTHSLGTNVLSAPADLHARSVGTVLRPGYRIEKIAFESLPGVLVPAHLYMPEELRSRAPAVLFYVGHWWPDGKTRPDFQAFCINMARLGFVVLAWDPFGQGERGISSRDHRRVEGLLVGVAQQGFAEHETQCALRYLMSRKEVDPERIGMTGASGGGYNTWITAALDDRIKVAVPVVGTSEFYEQISVTRPLDWYHASEHCHFIPGLIQFANNHEFVAMLAPKPLMIVAAANDQSFPIGGVQDVYDYARDLYRAYTTPERIGIFIDSEDGHGYQKRKREAAYGWFLRWLAGRGDGRPYAEPETETLPFDAAELRCFPVGRNEAAGPGMVAAVRLVASTLPARKSELSLPPMPIPPGIAVADAPLQRLEIPVSVGLRVPAFLLRPRANVRGMLVMLDDRGKESAAFDLPIKELVENGWAVLGLDPRYIGESATKNMGWVAAVSLLLGENAVMQQALDVRVAMSAVRRAFPGVSVGLYAHGPNACLAGSYAIASGEIRFYVLDGGFSSFRDWIERPRSMAVSFELKREDHDRTTSFDREIPFAYFPFEALRSFDLPDLLNSTRARGLVVNQLDGDWAPATGGSSGIREFLLKETAR